MWPQGQNRDNRGARKSEGLAGPCFFGTYEPFLFSGGGHGIRTRNPIRGAAFRMRLLAIRLPSGSGLFILARTWAERQALYVSGSRLADGPCSFGGPREPQPFFSQVIQERLALLITAEVLAEEIRHVVVSAGGLGADVRRDDHVRQFP